MALNQFIFGLIVAASFNLAPFMLTAFRTSTQPAKTVQVSIDVEADVLIEDSTHQRIGVDFKTRKFVNEIPGARTIEREGSVTFVLPFDKSDKPYTVMVAGKANTSANLSMTGPGFVVGARKLNLTPGEIEIVTISANGTSVSVVQSRDGPTPQLFLTSQSDRTQPSYRFEVAAAALSRGRMIMVDIGAGRLNFKSTDPNKSSFNVKMRRTNPGGSRDTYSHANVSFSRDNNYSVDFSKWDGKSDVCFYEVITRQPPCTALKNEAQANQPN